MVVGAKFDIENFVTNFVMKVQKCRIYAVYRHYSHGFKSCHPQLKKVLVLLKFQ